MIAVILVLCAVAVVTLSCDHQWQDATCADPITCTKCGKTEGEPLGHRWLDATCTAPETCSVCGETQGEALGHNWRDAACTTPSICNICGETQGEALGHDWLDATCTDPQICSICGDAQGHLLDHNWLSATCTDPETCSYCGKAQGEALGHSWLDASCTAPETCSRCGNTQGELLPHTWQDATCISPQACAVCGETVGELGEHSWLKATCLAAKTCATCGQTQGDRADHNWKSATCTKAKTCSVCGKTQGSALGHTWKDATCTTAKTCTTCGTTSGNALGHRFGKSENGKKTCSSCGEKVTIKYVAITFDDGPSGKITNTLLAGLAERNVKATFFLCGYRIDTYSSQPQTILNYGHEIGLHTDNHAILTKLSADGIRKELQDVLDLLPEGSNVTLMRPPGGAFNSTVKQVCADMGLSIIMWSVDPQDWATNNVSTITNRIVSNARNGSIILMHDLKSSSVQAALNAIDILQAQGYEFVTVSELAKIKGKTLSAGEVYYSLK